MKINLSDSVKIKRIKGFGVSSAWWSPQISDDKTAEEITELLYGNSGLKMNIYRYNAGGGHEEGNLRISNPWRRAESFMEKDGTYNWDKDQNAVNVMRKALDKGNIDTLIFFVNSPHFTHTVTGQTSGGFTEYFSNLAYDKYNAFAKYLIDIAEHFISVGYPVKYISPINEPQWKWGGDHVWQEGCHYEPEEVKNCFLAFTKELDRRRSCLRLYGPESGSITDHTKEYYSLLAGEPLIMKYLDAFAYHSYGSDDNPQNKIEFGKWAKENVKTHRLDMSEWCELPCRHDTDSVESALIMARIIGEDLIYSAADSWTAWVGANQWDNAIRDGKCYSDGLIAAKDDFSDYHISMRYYAMAHYSKYIPKNSISLDIGYITSRGFSVFAFAAPDGKKILVVSNYSKAKRIIEPDIDFGSAEIIITTQQEHLKSQIVTDKKIAIPPMSIATVIIR
ncbi:MAG: glycoside hydrolase [Eubacterium sp.]